MNVHIDIHLNDNLNPHRIVKLDVHRNNHKDFYPLHLCRLLHSSDLDLVTTLSFGVPKSKNTLFTFGYNSG